MNNFDCIVSLGYNCYPCMYNEKKTGVITKENFFDEIATPAWAINEILKKNFEGFFTKNNFDKMQLFEDSRFEFLTNRPYYIRLTQKYQMAQIESIFNLFKQRKNNFLGKLKSDKKILLIRYEEPMSADMPILGGKRIMREEYAEYYKQTELYQMQQLSNYLKATYPELNFNIMLIGNTLNPSEMNLDYDKDAKIFTIPNQDINLKNYETVFDKIFAEHGEFITKSLNLA